MSAGAGIRKHAVGIDFEAPDADEGHLQRVHYRLGGADADAESGVSAGAGVDEDGIDAGFRAPCLFEHALDVGEELDGVVLMGVPGEGVGGDAVFGEGDAYFVGGAVYG